MITGLLAFMVFLAFLLAFWEIQIEGKDGWAAKLPGWRIEKGWLVKLVGDMNLAWLIKLLPSSPEYYSFTVLSRPK